MSYFDDNEDYIIYGGNRKRKHKSDFKLNEEMSIKHKTWNNLDICDMEDLHLLNSYKLAKRKFMHHLIIKNLKEELDKRRISYE